MAVNVELQYNPFLPQLSILINGKQPPEYSKLTQYTDEDIWKWHSELLTVLYEELNDNFSILFTGTRFDASILQLECQNNSHCFAFTAQTPIIDTPLQKRLGILNQIIKNHNLINYQRTILEPVFIIPDLFQSYLNDILSIDINNFFCKTQIQTADISAGNFKDTNNTFLFVLAENLSQGQKKIQHYHSQNPIFLLYQGTQTCLKEVTSTYLAYECDFDDIISAIFDCFLGFPLTLALRNCSQSLLNNTDIEEELHKAVSFEPFVDIIFEPNIEVGKSNPIRFTLKPLVSSAPQILFKVLNTTIATTDNLSVFGIKAGKTKLEAYYSGTKKPFKIIDLNVCVRNRIQKIVLDDDELLLGVGDTKILNFSYFPPNADNTSSITWKSSNSAIADIDSYGKVTCKSSGQCKLFCIAENVSTAYSCEVRPYAESLEVKLPDENHLTLEPMQEYELEVQIYPSNSIDNTYTITSTDYNIANIIGNKILAKNEGITTIEVVNISRRKKTSFKVTVSKPKLGFFRSLFKK